MVDSQNKRNLPTIPPVGSIDKMTHTYHILMQILATRPIEAPSPGKDVESLRIRNTIVIPASTYVAGVVQPYQLSSHLRVLVLTCRKSWRCSNKI